MKHGELPTSLVVAKLDFPGNLQLPGRSQLVVRLSDVVVELQNSLRSRYSSAVL